jgi:spermidine/putrescine transport system substrate-binding protein
MAKRPVDPRMEFLRRAMSRRGFLGAAGAIGAASALAACGTGGNGGDTGTGPTGEVTFPEDISDTDRVVRWANWPDYMDVDDDDEYGTLRRFEEETGISVTYSTEIDDNDPFWGKVNGQLRNGQDIGFDIVTPTDWMASRFIQYGYAQPLQDDLIPNKGNILDSLADVGFDPGRRYSMTWQSGFAGIYWNKQAAPNGVRSVEDLFTNPALKGRITVLGEMRDTMGIVLMSQGVDIEQGITEEQFQNGLDYLDQLLSDGTIYNVQGNSYREDLRSGKALAGIGWSGDIFIANAEEGDRWGFDLPESGGTLWSDNLLIPSTANHQKNAHAIMDFYYDPANAAELAAWVNYISPVEGAREEMEQIDPELAESPWIFPDDQILSRASVFPALTPEVEETYSSLWQSTARGS